MEKRLDKTKKTLKQHKSVVPPSTFKFVQVPLTSSALEALRDALYKLTTATTTASNSFLLSFLL